MPIHIAVRAAVLSLIAAAFTLTMIVLVRSQSPAVVIVVHEMAPAPSPLFAPPVVAWGNCWGYSRWNPSVVDPRWWCGID